MPELPEVETLRRGLQQRLAGRTIEAFHVHMPKMLAGSVRDPQELARQMQGQRILSVGRRGKYLIIALDSGYYVLLHLKMRGQLLVIPRAAAPAKYLAFALDLDDGNQLRFHDMWTWGELRLVSASELAGHPALAAMGREPLADDWAPADLAQALARRPKTPVKAALLDQTVVAGIGNIYADESLFRSGIHPLRPAGSLASAETERLHQAIRSVLTEATGDGGTTSDNYVDSEGRVGRYTPRVYERGGQPCGVCGTILTRIRLTGRGTVYCRSCQS